MDQASEQPTTSLMKRVVRWLENFDRAMDMEPIDHLEARVAHLERRIAVLRDGDASIEIRSFQTEYI